MNTPARHIRWRSINQLSHLEKERKGLSLQ